MTVTSWECCKAYPEASQQHRICMACGASVTMWWRKLGGPKSDRMSAGQYRVVLCDTCAAALVYQWQMNKV